MDWKFDESIKILKEIKADCEKYYNSKIYPNCYLHDMRIAVCFLELGKQQEAKEEFQRIINELKASTEEDHIQMLADAYSNLSVINSSQGNLEEALENERRSYTLIKENFNDQAHDMSLAISLYHIGEYE